MATNLYVDSSWSSCSAGDPVIMGDDILTFGVDAFADIQSAVNAASASEATTINVYAGTYADNIYFLDSKTGGQKADITIQAADGVAKADVNISGSIQIGKRGSESWGGIDSSVTVVENWDSDVTIQGVTLSGANVIADYCEDVNIANCVVDGANVKFSYAVPTVTNSDFKNNAYIQTKGTSSGDLTVTGGSFTDSRINITSASTSGSAKEAVIENVTFNSTIPADQTADSSFYAIRTKGDTVVVQGCTFNIDSELADSTAVPDEAGDWSVLRMRTATSTLPWTIEDCTVNFTENAANLEGLNFITNDSTSANAANIMNVTNLTATTYDDEGNQLTGDAAVAALAGDSEGFVKVDGEVYDDGTVVSLSTIYINSAWDGSTTKIADGIVYGVNAFNNIDAVFALYGDKDHRNTETNTVQFLSDTTAVATGKKFFYSNVDVLFTATAGVTVDLSTYSRAYLMGYYTVENYQGAPANVPTFTIDDNVTVNFFSNDGYRILMVGQAIDNPDDVDGNGDATRDPGAAKLIVNGTINAGQVYTAPYSTIETGTHGVITYTAGYKADAMIIRSNSEIDINGDGNHTLLQFHPNYVSNQGGTLKLRDAYGSTGQFGTSDQTKDLVNTDANVILDNSILYASTLVLSDTKGTVSLTNGSTLAKTNGEALGGSNAGTINIEGASKLVLGTVTNTGTINVIGNGNTVTATALSGAGSVTFKNAALDNKISLAGSQNVRFLGTTSIANPNLADLTGNFYVGTYGLDEAEDSELTINGDVTFGLTYVGADDEGASGKTAKLDIAAGKTLTVGSLYARKSSTITVNTGAKLLSGYGSLQGTINVDGGVVKFSSETVKHDMSISATNGGVIDLGYTEGQTDRRHTYSLTNGSILTVGILYNTDIAITMDSSSTLALAPRAQDVADGTKLAITVTVDSAFTGVKKLIDMNAKYDYTTQTYTDTGSVAMTVDDYKRIVTNWNDNFTVIDNDLYLSNVDVDDVYVNSDWAEAGYKYGEAFTYGDKTLYYGINAFSSVKDAYDSGNMNGATTNVIKTLGEQTTGNPDWAEIVVESDGAYTLTGGDHGLVPYFEIDNTEGTLTTMTIEDADLMMEKFGARRNGLVRVTNSTIEVEHPIGSNATTTIYYNGNVSLTDTTFSVWQTTVTGVLTVSGQSSTYYSPWQTQVWFTGQITVEDGATWTTGAFGVGGSKTSAGYISRRNTDFAEGVNVATFTVNNATLDAGSDYRSGTYGMEIGTYADSTAAFNVLNDSTATLYINAGATSTFKKVQFGQYATVSVDNSVLNIGGSANAENFLNEGSLTLSNGATLNATIAATNTGAIALDVTSTLNGTTLDNASGTITIDATGFTSGVKKVIDLSQAAALTNVAFKEDTAAEGVKLALGADGDVVVYKLATSALYVNSDWAGSQTGAEVGGEGSGKFYGINAFDNFKSALSVAQDNAGGTISFDTMGYTYAAPQTDDAYAATISVPGTYVLTDGNGALLNYELEVNVNKDTENDYALTIDDAFITLTKLTTRYNTDVTITDSRVDFNQFQGGSAYLSIYNGSALTISGSTVGFDPHQSGKASPDELPDAGTGAGSYWNWAPRVVVYGETRITDSKMYVYVGQGVQTGFDILGNSDTEVKNSTVSLAQLNVGNKSSEFQTKRLGQNDDANNLNASLLIDNSTILNTQYRGDNTTKNGIIVGENDSVKGAMTVTNGSLVDFTKLTYGGDREIGLQVRSGSTVSISSNSTMKMPKVSNSGTINLDGSATLSATNGIANDGIIKLTGTNTLTGAITGAGTLKFDGATINDAITASTNAGVFSGTNAINADLTIDTYKQGYDTALNTADSTTTVTGAKLTAHNFYIGSNKLGGVTNKLVATNGASLLSDQPHNTTTFYVRGNGIMDLTDSTLGGYYKDGVGYDPEGTKINVVHLMNYGAVSLTNSNAYFDGFVVYGGDINDTDGTDGFTSASFAATDSNITIAGVNGSKFTVGGITTSAIVGGKGSKGTGDVTLSNSTFTVGTNFVVGFDKNGSVTMSDGSTLSVANGMIGLGLDAGNGTLTVDATSSVNAKDVNVGANGTISITVGGTITAETFTNGGTITIDATGITGYADVITVTGGDAQMGGTINLIKDEGSKLDVIKHANGSVSVGIVGDDLYFNSAWSADPANTEYTVDGTTKVHKGVDAFAELGDATATAGKTLHFISDSSLATAASGMLDGSTLVKGQDAAADVTVSLSGASFVQQKGDLTIGQGATLAATKLMHFAKDTTITVDGTFQAVSNAYLYAGKMIVNGSLTGDDVFLNGSGENTYELTANGAIDVAKLRVGANATLNLEGGNVTAADGMSVTAESGTVNVNEHATIDGGLTNGGTINVADGKALSLTGAVDNSGKINLGTDSTLNTAGATFTNKSAGVIMLNGTLSNVTGLAANEGAINVGTSTLRFLGDGNKLTNAAGGNVSISVGGLLSAASLENNGTITVAATDEKAWKAVTLSSEMTGTGSITGGNVILRQNGTDYEYWVSTASQETLYVNSGYTGEFGEKVAEGKYFGINAFNTFSEALTVNAATSIVLESSVTESLAPQVKTLTGALSISLADGVSSADINWTVSGRSTFESDGVAFFISDTAVDSPKLTFAEGVNFNVYRGSDTGTATYFGYNKDQSITVDNSGAINVGSFYVSRGTTYNLTSTGTIDTTSVYDGQFLVRKHAALNITGTGESYTLAAPQVKAGFVTLQGGVTTLTDTVLTANSYIEIYNRNVSTADVNQPGEQVKFNVINSTVKAATFKSVASVSTSATPEDYAVTLTNSDLVITNSITNPGAITLDLSSTITAASIANTGTITVDATGYDASMGLIKLIDVDNAAAYTGNAVTVVNGDASKLNVIDGDVYYGSGDQSQLFVDLSYTGAAGTVVDGHIIGFNAFSTLTAALTVAAARTADTTITVSAKESAFAESYNDDLMEALAGNVTIEGAAITLNNTVGGRMDLCFMPVDGKTLAITAPITMDATSPATTAGIWLNHSGAGTTDVSATIDSKSFIGINSTVNVDKDATLLTDGNIQIGRAHDELATALNIVGTGRTFAEDEYQVSATAMQLVEGVMNTTDTKVKVGYLSYTDSMLYTDNYKSGEFTLNSANTAWTVANDVMVRFYTAPANIAGNAAATLNFDNSTVTVGGSFVNVPYATTNGTDSANDLTGNAPALTVNLTNGSTLSVTNDLTNAGVIDAKGSAITVGGNVTGTGSIALDATSSLTVAGTLTTAALTNNGTINLSLAAVTLGADTIKLVDITDATCALDVSKINITGDYTGYEVKAWNNDLFLSKASVDTSTLYVNDAWAGMDFGTVVGDDMVVGINAFANLSGALVVSAKENTEHNIYIQSDVEIDSFDEMVYRVNLISDKEGGVTVNNYYQDWLYIPGYVSIGEGVTLNTPFGFIYGPNNNISGTMNTYQAYNGYGGVTTVTGLLTETSQFVIRYQKASAPGGFIFQGNATLGQAENTRTKQFSQEPNGFKGVGDDAAYDPNSTERGYMTFYSGVIRAKDAYLDSGETSLTNMTDRNVGGNYADCYAELSLDNTIWNMGGFKTNGDVRITVENQSILRWNSANIWEKFGSHGGGATDPNDADNKTVATISGSTLNIAGAFTNNANGEFTFIDSILTVGTTLTNTGTITVSGASLLTIGTLTGTITVNGNATLTGSSVGGAGNIEVAAGKVLTVGDATETATSFGAVTNDGEIDIDGALVNLGAITNNGTINMDWQDKLTFSGFTGSAINFNMTDYTGVETATKVLDYTGTGTMDAADYQAMLGMNATDFNKYFEVGTDDDANDLFLKVGGATKLYVGGEGTGHYAPTSVGLSDAVTAAKGLDAELTVINGTFSDLAVLNDVVTLIEDGTFSKNIVAGQSLAAASARKKVTVGEDEDVNTNLTINSGTYQYVYGADRLTLGSLDHFGSVNLTINGGMFNKAVVGGIAYAQTSTSAMADLIGDINMTITGGTFKEYVYGGCIASSKNLGAHTTIEGDITMTIDVAGDKTVTFEKNIIVGSMGSGYVSKNLDTGDGGNVELVLTGNGTINLSGETSQIWGGCSSDQYFTNSSTGARRFETNIEGNRTLTFTGFTGTLNCNTIRGFNVFNATESNFMLNDGVNLNDIINWDISADSTISGNFYSNFAGDTLNVDLANWDNEAKAIFDDASKFSGMDENLTVTFGDAVASYQDGVWTAAEAGVKLYLEDNKVMLGIA